MLIPFLCNSSRMTSGIMSPSELPPSISTAISPSQSPRRISSRLNSPPPHQGHGAVRAPDRLRSVFEDEVNTFGVENTPAQFSCATSLSNLSLNLDDEPKIATDSLMKEMKLMSHPSEEHEEIGVEVIGAQQVDAIVQQGPSISSSAMSQQLVTSTVNDGTHSDSEDSVNDSMLLETCINIGMNKRDHGQDSGKSLNVIDIKECSHSFFKQLHHYHRERCPKHHQFRAATMKVPALIYLMVGMNHFCSNASVTVYSAPPPSSRFLCLGPQPT